MLSRLETRYFIWLCARISCGPRYEKLLRRLFEIDFYYLNPMDANRFEDGINLRYRFGRENDISDSAIACEIDYRPCSVFEMMAALAIRCEEDIMHNPELGDRSSVWFHYMLQNLGLEVMENTYYNKMLVDTIVERMLNREYDYNGAGGLFVVRHPNGDLRNVEIWVQLCWYLDDLIAEGI